jgi:cytochrome P450
VVIRDDLVEMDVDFSDPKVVADPFPIYEEIRAAGRVVRNELGHCWMLPGYDDYVKVFTDHAHFSADVNSGEQPYAPWMQVPTMLFADPPEHTRLRNILHLSFTRKQLADWGPMVQRTVDSLLAAVLDRLADGEPVDVNRELFRSLPTRVITAMLGVGADHWDLFHQWTDETVLGIGASSPTAPDGPARLERALRAHDGLSDHLQQEIDEQRRSPRDDTLIGQLVLANDDGLLTADELRETAVVLLAAGNETTYKFIGNTLNILGRHPDVRRRLVADPSLVPAALEESLRLEGVSQGGPRIVRADVEIAGTTLRAGEFVHALKAAANRDPLKFANPATYEIDRSPNPHLAFSYGIHLCIGANLARLETRVAVESFLRHVPEYEVVDVDYGLNFFQRGPDRLDVVASAVKT